MMSTNGLVREVLSRHLDRAPSRIRPEMTLETLDITPLELILVALEVEEREDVELAVENLAEVRTVGELMTFVSKSVAANPNRDHRHPDSEYRVEAVAC